MMKRLFAVLALGFCGALCLAAVAGITTTAGAAVACPMSNVRIRAHAPVIGSLDAEQVANARSIVATTLDRGMGGRAAVIAVATAMQESSLRNVPYGDRDSLGLFQQRPSEGWGTAEQVLDPVHATDSFLNRLRGVHGWAHRPLADVAQEVQSSAYPRAYARWEPLATDLVLNLVEPSPKAPGASTAAARTIGATTMTDPDVCDFAATPSIP